MDQDNTADKAEESKPKRSDDNGTASAIAHLQAERAVRRRSRKRKVDALASTVSCEPPRGLFAERLLDIPDGKQRRKESGVFPGPESARQRWKVLRHAKIAQLDVLAGREPTKGWSPMDIEGPDLPLRDRHGRQRGTLRRLFLAMRTQGLEPHPYGQERDAEVVRWVRCRLGLGENPESPPVPAPEIPASYSDESRTGPEPRLGVNHLPMFHERGDEYGGWDEILSDIHRTGAGSIRHIARGDLTWAALFGDIKHGDTTVPEPTEIYDWLTQSKSNLGDYARLQLRFGQVVWMCAAAGVQIVPTLFTLSESTRYLNDIRLTDDHVYDILNGVAASLAKQKTVVLLSSAMEGWSEFYWDFASEFSGSISTGTSNEVTYQQYVLNVCSENQGSFYMQEAARRKALAVAAYATAVGEYLATLATSFQMAGLSLEDTIPWLECGNEMEACWHAEEYGLFMALLAGPVRHAWSDARFRASELASWVGADEGFDTKLQWLEDAIVDGLEPEVDRWREVQEDCALFHLPCRHPSWINSCDLAGFYWPPFPSTGQDWLSTNPANLVHQLGFHWYHQDENAGAGYQGEGQLYSDAKAMQELVSDLSGQRGYTLTWSVSEVGFQAINNPDGMIDDPRERPAQPYYREATSPEFQAGELLRRLLLLHAMDNGPQVVCWHNFMSLVKSTADPQKWNLFTAHGLRNDVHDDASFERDVDAWRRPSWFSFRRLVWLLGQATSAEVLHNKDDVTVVRLESDSGFLWPLDPDFGDTGTIDPAASSELYQPRRYAYLAWMDQSPRSSKRWYLNLWDAATSGYRLLSIVPKVTPSTATPAVTDENGFASGESVDWHWSGWDWPLIKTEASGTGQQIDVQLKPLDDSEGRPSPICLLTDAILLSEKDGFVTMTELTNWKVEQQMEWAESVRDQTEIAVDEAGRILAEMRALLEDIGNLPWDPTVESTRFLDQAGWLRDVHATARELVGVSESLNDLAREDVGRLVR